MGDLKIWDPFINHTTIILRGFISNIKIYRALKYIILNILGMIAPIHTKIKVFCYEVDPNYGGSFFCDFMDFL